MPLSRFTTLLGGSALVAALVAERRRRGGAERLGAALFETLLNAIDANDSATGRHVRRVAAYALVLADAAELPEPVCREVEHVALFHDIGKIHEALFDIVHEGSRRLSVAAREAIATHPARGADVLAPLTPFYPHLAPGVLAHHERWDGSGYPRGLAGEEIPLPARVVTIADTFDAMTHARRYSAGRSAADARDVIARGRGAQFDPLLVDVFLRDDVQRALEQVRQEQWRPHRRPDRRRPYTEALAPEVAFRWRERIVDESADAKTPSSRRSATRKPRPDDIALTSGGAASLASSSAPPR